MKPASISSRVHAILRLRTVVCSLVATIALPMLSPVAQANPVPVTYNGTVYDISYYLGDFNTQPPGVSLQSQVWFGNAAMASDFATLLGGSLGFGNFNSQSPYFVYSLSNDLSTWNGNFYDIGGFVSGHMGVATEGWLGRFAYVTASAPVATPDGGTSVGLILGALAALGFVRRRLKVIAA